MTTPLLGMRIIAADPTWMLAMQISYSVQILGNGSMMMNHCLVRIAEFNNQMVQALCSPWTGWGYG